WGLWVGRSQRYAHADAFALASTLADIAERLEDPRYRRLADYARAHCEYWVGRIQQAHDHLDEIDPLNAQMMIEWLPFSDHPQVTAACFQGWALCLRGDYQRAERHVSSAIRLAEKIGHPGTLAMALMFAAALYRQLGHVHLAARHAERAAAMTGTPDLQLWQISAQCVLGWQRAMAGDHAGLVQLRDSLDQMAELNGRDRFQRPVLWYSDACIELGELKAAEEYLDQCLVIARERTTLFLPELATQLARVRDLLGHPASEVKALAEMAIVQSREHGNRHQELAALELWLTRISPNDQQAKEAFRRLLSEVSHSDAPVLVRWVSLLGRRLPHSLSAENEA
ncbi:MAG: ATPase, partial [Pseudomonadota bacterium]|nr:ATPase [Pseudomonadota bacterium]